MTGHRLPLFSFVQVAHVGLLRRASASSIILRRRARHGSRSGEHRCQQCRAGHGGRCRVAGVVATSQAGEAAAGLPAGEGRRVWVKIVS